jgi:hypothetical protein
MSPNKLTDTQLVLLCAASQREDGAIDPAQGLKGGLAKKAIGELLTDGLVEEVPAGSKLPAWRRDDDCGLALCITARGLAAIGIDKLGTWAEAPLLSGATADQGDSTPDTPSQGTSAPQKAAQSRRATARRKSKGSKDESPRPRASKQSRVIEMLQRGQGSTIAAIVKAWAGSRTPSAVSLPARCARSSASRLCPRRPAPSGSTASSPRSRRVRARGVARRHDGSRRPSARSPNPTGAYRASLVPSPAPIGMDLASSVCGR